MSTLMMDQRRSIPAPRVETSWHWHHVGLRWTAQRGARYQFRSFALHGGTETLCTKRAQTVRVGPPSFSFVVLAPMSSKTPCSLPAPRPACVAPHAPRIQATPCTNVYQKKCTSPKKWTCFAKGLVARNNVGALLARTRFYFVGTRTKCKKGAKNLTGGKDSGIPHHR